jgi:hypothetical protein
MANIAQSGDQATQHKQPFYRFFPLISYLKIIIGQIYLKGSNL